jgi:ATP-binding cassette, subfamily B, bacterial IrtB/YbtQ
VDGRELTPEGLMGQLWLVFQDVYLFDDTLEAQRAPRPVGRHRRAGAGSVPARRVDEIVERPPGAGPPAWRGRRVAVGRRAAADRAGEGAAQDAPIVLLDEAIAALDPARGRRERRSLA